MSQSSQISAKRGNHLRGEQLQMRLRPRGGSPGGSVLDRCGIGADRGDRLIQLGLAATGNKYARAFVRETLRDAEADPGAAAGHDSDFACELAGHGDLFPGAAVPVFQWRWFSSRIVQLMSMAVGVSVVGWPVHHAQHRQAPGLEETPDEKLGQN